MHTILVVDDEPKIRELVRSYLEAGGYRALCAKNGQEALKLFEEQVVDLVLLDLMLPDYPGEQLCARLRERSNVPIIMVTAKVDEQSIIRGLNTGADDYVCKPFSPRELIARIKAALRRSGSGREALLACGELTIDTETRVVCLREVPLALTRDEYKILLLLMSQQNKTFTRDEILDAVKGDDFDGFDRSIDSHVKRLRAKIGDDPRAPRYIVTVYGVGYRLGAHT